VSEAGGANGAAGTGPENAAWVDAEIPVAPQALAAFLSDPVALYRLNPSLEIEILEVSSADARRFRLRALNESNGMRYDVTVERSPLEDGALGWRYAYDCGFKRATEFRIEPGRAGSILRVKEYYERYADPGDAPAQEFDRSLVPWIAALRRHLVRWKRFGRVPFYAWWVQRMWLHMTPRQRRIARLIWWIGVLEFVVFLFVFAIYWAEMERA